MTWRNLVRRMLPLALRQNVAQWRRQLRDYPLGARLMPRHAVNLPDSWQLLAEIRQPVMPSTLLENKLINLRLGANKLNLALIEPHAICSFWRHVGRPVAQNGFMVGRNLVEGELTRQVGGGLCQLSSILYHLGLRSGLEVVERHAHSIDIYQEHERFTPLGADATVVWGYKDLRLCNPHPLAILLEFEVHADALVGRSWINMPLRPCEVTFEREQLGPEQVRVHTLVDGRTLAQTLYKQRPGLALPTARQSS